MAPRLLTSILFRPARLLLVSLVLVYVSTQLVMHYNNQNPNSHFFDPNEDTYAPTYSAIQKQLAKDYIASKESLLLQGEPVRTNPAKPDLGVVFVTVKRKTEQYLDVALGSFLNNLTNEERERMFISVNIGDFNPIEHPFYESTWLHGLVDQIGVRMATRPLDLHLAPKSSLRLAAIKLTPVRIISTTDDPLKTSTWHRKATLDYAFALATCHEIGAPHCLIVEDDTVFAADWYKQVDSLFIKADRVASPHHWGYIRLFWAERYFGWENEEVPKLVLGCVSAVLISAVLLFGFCRLPRRHALDREKDRELYQHDLNGRLRSEVARVRLPLASIALLLVIVLFHAILFILAGRNHVYHVPRGLSVMAERGCCTQGIVYPLDVILPLSTHLSDHSGQKPYDIMINRWMESQQREKLAINPPVIQHIGEGSSRQMAEDYWRRTPLWSFAFEQMQPLKG